MAAIAFLTHNLMIGCVMGSYSVLITPIEAKMGVSRDVSSLGIPLTLLAISLSSPIVGILVSKFSIRLLSVIGALMSTVGFAILAVAGNVVAFILVYGLLFGPAMALNSTVLPTTLVTRWYNVNRGRTLGIVNMPLLAFAMAPVTAEVLKRFGLSATYLMLGGLSAVLLLAVSFVVDYPPDAARPAGGQGAAEPAATSTMSVLDVLRQPRFWAVSMGFAAITSGASTFSAHVVPLATGWGIEATRAAALVSFSAIGGMVGSAAYGWIADRLGGATTLAIMCMSAALLWAALLLQPPYAAMALIAALMGFSSGSIVPVLSVALGQLFGRPNFGRTFGTCYLVNLPFMVLGVPAAAHVYVVTGSYAGALAGLAAFSLLCGICAALGRAGKPAAASS